MSLSYTRLQDALRAAVCAARAAGCHSRISVGRQPGRERPRIGCPRLRPTAVPRGVAHAPAACLVCPDARTLALVVGTTQCWFRKRVGFSSRTAPRDGDDRGSFFPEREDTMPLIKPRTRG